MSARSIGTVLGGTPKKARRTFQPVRRNSYHVGERERRIWSPIDRREIGARIRAAEAFDRQHKAEGKRNGALGHIGLEVLRELYRIVDWKTGRLEPSIDYICRRIRRARAAVVRALARLKAHGFVKWIRRTEPTENEGSYGPQVRQIPNAYWFELPKSAADAVRRVVGNAPPPDDAIARRAEHDAEAAAMLDGLSAAELARAIISDPDLAELLARFGDGIERSNASSSGGQNPPLIG